MTDPNYAARSPWNESPSDLRREALVLNEIAAAVGFVSWRKLKPLSYKVDAAFFDNRRELAAWIEVKVRDRFFDPTWLGTAKAGALYRLTVMTRVPAYFAVHVPEGIFWHRIRPVHEYRIVEAGGERGQQGDIEPCICIDRAAFSLIAPPLNIYGGPNG